MVGFLGVGVFVGGERVYSKSINSIGSGKGEVGTLWLDTRIVNIV